MKKFFALGSCLASLSAVNAYAITATSLTPIDYINAIPNERPILLPQDPKHFLVYTNGEITLVDAVKNTIAGTINKPQLYENLQSLFALQSGKLLALDATGLYTSKNLGKNWEKISENIFGHEFQPPRFLQNKTHAQNLFAITDEKIFLSHDEGHTWQILWEEKSFNVNCHPFDILQAINGTIYIITHHGKVQVTHDEGKMWQELTNNSIPPEPDYWVEKAFCSLGDSDKGYIRVGKQLFEIKSPQEVRLVYEDKNNNNDCFVDNQQNLYVTNTDDKETQTNITLLDQTFKEIPINTFQGKIYNITQDSDGKSYMNTSLGLATAQTLKSPIDLYPAIFKQGMIHKLSVNNETDLVTNVGYDNWQDPFETYSSQDGGNHYTHLAKKYYELFYFKGALTYLVRCNSQLCLNTSNDNGKTWSLAELPKDIKAIFGMFQDRGMFIIQASQGYFLSSDLENWNAILTTDIYHSTKLAATLKKHKPLSIATLKEKQTTEPKKVKSLKVFNAPHTDCLFNQLEVNISPTNIFTLLQHGCRDDDDIYLSKDEGAHWERAHADLPASVLDSPFHIPNVFLTNGDLILVDYYGNSLQKSSDGGMHFNNLISKLPPMNLGGENIFAHFGTSLFALGSVYGNGVYFSRNAGETWERLNIINSVTFDLQFANNKLFIATEGDGLFNAII